MKLWCSGAVVQQCCSVAVVLWCSVSVNVQHMKEGAERVALQWCVSERAAFEGGWGECTEIVAVGMPSMPGSMPGM